MIKQNLRNLKGFLHRLCVEHTMPILITMVLTTILIFYGFATWLSQYLVQASSLSGAIHYLDTIAIVRDIYSDQMTEEYRNKNIPASHSYAVGASKMLLPATFTRAVGKRLEEKESGLIIRLYSDYPTPWKKEPGSPKDEFEVTAIKEIKNNPGLPYYRIENFNSKTVLRYAIADRMYPSCINCHNSYVDQPKNNWKVGDVRGVLEVIRPLNAVTNEVSTTVSVANLVLLAVIALGFSGLFLVFRALATNAKELKNAITVRDDFISMAAHDLRSPLTPLLMIVQLNKELARRGELANLGEEKLAGIFEQIERHSKRYAVLIDNLLDVTRISSKQLKLNKADIDFSKVVQKTMDYFKDDLIKTDTKLTTKIIPSIVGHWDEFRLEQVVANLLSNAIKYGRGKPIEVTLTSDSKMAILNVRDSGPGISQDNLPRLFEKFTRFAGTSKIPGLGLGLFIVQNIVDAHCGTISVESKLGEGSTFTVKLPLSYTMPG